MSQEKNQGFLKDLFHFSYNFNNSLILFKKIQKRLSIKAVFNRDYTGGTIVLFQ